MWHPIERVIEINHLDPKVAEKVAHANSEKFRLVDGYISTWRVNDFIAAVKAEMKEETDERRRIYRTSSEAKGSS